MDNFDGARWTGSDIGTDSLCCFLWASGQSTCRLRTQHTYSYQTASQAKNNRTLNNK